MGYHGSRDKMPRVLGLHSDKDSHGFSQSSEHAVHNHKAVPLSLRGLSQVSISEANSIGHDYMMPTVTSQTSLDSGYSHESATSLLIIAPDKRGAKGMGRGTGGFSPRGGSPRAVRKTSGLGSTPSKNKDDNLTMKTERAATSGTTGARSPTSTSHSPRPPVSPRSDGRSQFKGRQVLDKGGGAS